MVLSRSRTALVAAAVASLVLLPLGVAPSGADPVAAGGSEEPAPAAADGQRVTLITGDQLLVRNRPAGRSSVAIEPAPREGYEPTFQTSESDGQLYVVPSDAARLIPHTLDRELFNVTKLASYDDTRRVPAIVQYATGQSMRALGSTPGMTRTATLSSIDAVAATVGGAWWRRVTGRAGTPTARALTAAGPLANVDKVWLDEQVQVNLDESVGQIGAPQAWEAGYDGSGITVGVLDTGIDTDHPDLAGKVTASESFVFGVDSVHDGHGHGTHVASTIAGSGAASDGRYTGVAPGADLVVGKVLDDFGFGAFSQIIDGMEWAAAQDADIVNLSLGCGPFNGCPENDGTDPASQAVNRLTATTDTLFVIAAGNDGPGAETLGRPGVADAALTVGAVDGSDQLANFSSRGPRSGDSAVKPDVTAPGVDIAAARSAGTDMRGDALPIDDNYIRASGTSMATPHTAGAAALLLQRKPNLTPAELKATLTTTAVPSDGISVYEQGGGRIYLPRAMDTPVRATPAPLNLGLFRYPHDDAEPVTEDVTYTNLTDAPITLDLALDVTTQDGARADDDLLSLGAESLTLEPGASTPVGLTVDVTNGAVGRYGGYLVASVDGSAVTRTPVGFVKESEHYDLTIRGIARDGQPARFNSSVDVLDVRNISRFDENILRFTDGAVRLRVPPGTYAAMGLIETYVEDQFVAHERSFVADPEFEVAGDKTIVLDARDAEPIEIDAPGRRADSPRDHTTLSYYRSGSESGEEGVLFLGPAWTEYSATPTEPVTHGEFEFFSHWRLGRPEITADVIEPVEQAVDPLYMLQSPILNGELEGRLVDAGQGSAAEFAAVDADGAIALVRRGGPWFDEKEANASAAGAVALLIANDAPGQIPNYGVGSSAQLPTLKLSQSDGDALVDLLPGGDVRMRLTGHRNSPHLYELVLPERDRIPSDLSYDIGRDELATLANRFHSDVPRDLTEYRNVWRPWMVTSVVFNHDVYAPYKRTEHLIAGDTRYAHVVDGMDEPVRTYQPRQRLNPSWWRPILRPGIPPEREVGADGAAYRDGDSVRLELAEWVDADGHWADRQGGIDTTAFRFYEDGEPVADTSRPRGTFAVSSGAAEYRLELDVARDADWWHTSTATHTAWTVRSSGSTDAPRPLPLLELDYDVDVDLSNTAEDGSQARTLGVDVSHQRGVAPKPISSLRVWISYDDGESWLARPVRRADGGGFEVVMPRRTPDTGFASVRAVATDAEGNRFEQEVIRAWRLG